MPDAVDERLTALTTATGKGKGEVVRDLFEASDALHRRLGRRLRRELRTIRNVCAELRSAEDRSLARREELVDRIRDAADRMEAAVEFDAGGAASVSRSRGNDPPRCNL